VRVVLDCRYVTDPPSGVGAYVAGLARRLPALAPDDDFVFWCHPTTPLPLVAAPNVTHVVVPTRANGLGTLLWPGRLAPLSASDVFHSPHNLLGRGLPCPAVVTVHDLMWLQAPALCQGRRLRRLVHRAYFGAGIRNAVRRAARILTVSRASAEALVAWAPELRGRVHVTPNAVEPVYAPAANAAAGRAAAAAVLGTAAPFFLVVGQNQPSKGHDLALRAFAAAARGDELLVLVQRRNPRGALARLARELGVEDRVRFVRTVALPDLLALFHGATALLQPSLAEGFGLPALEALATGCPVVASDIPPLVEVLGGAGVHVPAGDAAALGQALRAVADDAGRRRELRARGLARAAAFRWEDSAREALAAYRAVAAEAPAPACRARPRRLAAVPLLAAAASPAAAVPAAAAASPAAAGPAAAAASPAAAVPRPARGRRPALGTVLNVALAVVGLGLFGGLLARLDPHAIGARLAQVGGYFGLHLAFHVLGLAVSALAWRQAIDPARSRVRFPEVLGAFWAGYAINALTPGASLGEVVRGNLLRGRVEGEELVASIVTFHFLSTGSLLLFTLLGPLLGLAMLDLPRGVVLTLLAIAGGFLVLFVGAWLLLRVGVLGRLVALARRLPGLRLRDPAALAARAAAVDARVRSFRRARPAAFRRLILCLAAARLLMAAEYWALLVPLLPDHGAAWLFGLALLTQASSQLVTWAATLVPGQLGVAESNTALLYQLLGFGAAFGLSVEILRRLRTLIGVGAGLLVGWALGLRGVGLRPANALKSPAPRL
jgi:glycosyltransferase involved in cell wall biosynthesis/uncharacterized membrane protein YbhN (UPF0104 family)